MKGLTLFRRTTKSEGMIKLRFRLKDGREVDLYHKSETKADIKDLTKLEDAGELRPKVSIYNHELKEKIDREMSAIETAYIELCAKMDKSLITATLFEETICRHLHPQNYIAVTKEETLLERYTRFIKEGYRDGTFAEKRMLQYNGLYNELKRYLTIRNQLNVLPKSFSADDLMKLRLFLLKNINMLRNTQLYIAKSRSVVFHPKNVHRILLPSNLEYCRHSIQNWKTVMK